MKTVEPVPSALAYTAAIEACARANRADEMARFYQEMRSHSIPGDIETYRWLLRAYGAARRMADAVDTWRGMKEVCVRVCAPLCGLMALRIAWPTRLTLGAA